MKKVQIVLICLSFLCIYTICSCGFDSSITDISVGSGPSGLACTPNGSYVYVANKTANTVSVINTKTNVVIKTITGFDGPNSVTINPLGTKAYVTNATFGGANTVSVVDTVSTSSTFNTIVATIGGFNAPYAMAIMSSGEFGYVANYGDPSGVADNTVRYVNLTTNSIVGSAIVVGNYPAAISITPNSRYAYVSNYNTGVSGSGTISVIDTVSTSATFNTVIKTITGLFGPRQIAIDPKGAYAYVVNYGNNVTSPSTSTSAGTTVSVIDSNSANSSTFNTIVETITVGSQPSGITINPSGNYAYVTLYNDGKVGSLVTIQLSDNTVLSPSVVLRKGPLQAVVLPNGLSVYVVDYNDTLVQMLSVVNSLTISLLHIPALLSITVHLSNLYLIAQCPSTPLTVISNLLSSTELTDTDYSMYNTVVQLLKNPIICSTLNPSYLAICGKIPKVLRVFINGVIVANPFGGAIIVKPGFYFDIPYFDKNNKLLLRGASSFNIDFTTMTAQLITSSSTTFFPGTIYVIPDNYNTC